MELFEQFLGPGTGKGGDLFWAALIAVALWEHFRPLRPLNYSVPLRWINNIALAAVNIGFVQLLLLAFALDYIALAGENERGLFHAASLPAWLAVLLGVAWLDLVFYATHRLSHAVPLFWRLHRVHHSDPDVDFTTSERHHPAEIFIAAPILTAGILIVGVPPLALAIWWALSGTISLLQHSNLRLPGRCERYLRLVLITPAMHRTHHSARRSETDSNYGQLFPWWDYLFGSYCAQPEGGLSGMTIGLEHFRQREDLFLHRMLLQPFAKTGKPAATTPKPGP